MEDKKQSTKQAEEAEIYDIEGDDDELEEVEPVEWNNQPEDEEDLKQWYIKCK